MKFLVCLRTHLAGRDVHGMEQGVDMGSMPALWKRSPRYPRHEIFISTVRGGEADDRRSANVGHVE